MHPLNKAGENLRPVLILVKQEELYNIIRESQNEETQPEESLTEVLKKIIKEKDTISMAELQKITKAKPEQLEAAILKLLQWGDIYESKPSVFRWLG